MRIITVYLLLTGFSLLGCAGSKPKTSTDPISKESNLPTSSLSFAGDQAKKRSSLSDFEAGDWKLTSFASQSTLVGGPDQLFIRHVFAAGGNHSENDCSATGKWASVIVKNPAALSLAVQVPLHLTTGETSKLNNIQILRYGAVADLSTGGCIPSIKWMKTDETSVTSDFLSPLLTKRELVEKKTSDGRGQMRAALVGSGSKILLVYELKTSEYVMITEFTFERDSADSIQQASVETQPPAFDSVRDKSYAPLFEKMSGIVSENFVAMQSYAQRFRLKKLEEIIWNDQDQVLSRNVIDQSNLNGLEQVYPEFLLINAFGEFSLGTWNPHTMTIVKFENHLISGAPLHLDQIKDLLNHERWCAKWNSKFLLGADLEYKLIVLPPVTDATGMKASFAVIIQDSMNFTYSLRMDFELE